MVWQLNALNLHRTTKQKYYGTLEINNKAHAHSQWCAH